MIRLSALSCFITVLALAHSIEAFGVHHKSRSRNKHSQLGFGSSNRYYSYHVHDHPIKSLSSSLQLSLIKKNEEVQQQPEQQQAENNENLDKFRSLMGTLYGFAGIAHAFDCFIGPSQLLVAAGNLPFHELPIIGQAMATIWCISGPFSFVLSRQGSGALADVGLVVYGVVEVGVAAFSPDASTVVNASLVQGIVLAAWLYSRQKSDDDST